MTEASFGTGYRYRDTVTSKRKDQKILRTDAYAIERLGKVHEEDDEIH